MRRKLHEIGVGEIFRVYTANKLRNIGFGEIGDLYDRYLHDRDALKETFRKYGILQYEQREIWPVLWAIRGFGGDIGVEEDFKAYARVFSPDSGLINALIRGNVPVSFILKAEKPEELIRVINGIGTIRARRLLECKDQLRAALKEMQGEVVYKGGGVKIRRIRVKLPK